MKPRKRIVPRGALWGHTLLLLSLVSLAADQPGKQVSTSDSSKPPEKLLIKGIENTYRLSPLLYSGGDPRGKEAFSALRNLGIKTIISVDGTTPDVETARSLGLRYVHLPIGYDGIPRKQAVRLVLAVRNLPGPVYVHCHHGKHRGPAAAAVCGIVTQGWSKDRAIDWMKQAGASMDYRGLYASIRSFAPPSSNEIERVGSELPERSRVAALVEMMVQIDERWDNLKAIQLAGYRVPPKQPDIDPAHEALQLMELFSESARLADSQARGEAFSRTMLSTERLATNLRDAMRAHLEKPSSESLKNLETSFAAVGKNCTSCHVRYRDN